MLALLVGLALAGCGGEDEAEPSAVTEASVCDVADGSHRAEQVVVSGRGWALPPELPDIGFALSDAGCTILVAASRVDSLDARGGDAVRVEGIADALDDTEAERLRLGYGGRKPERVALPNDAPGRLPVAPGSPFIDAFAVTGEAVRD